MKIEAIEAFTYFKRFRDLRGRMPMVQAQPRIKIELYDAYKYR